MDIEKIKGRLQFLREAEKLKDVLKTRTPLPGEPKARQSTAGAYA